MKRLLQVFLFTALATTFSSVKVKAQGFQGGVIAGVSASQLIGTEIWGFTQPGVIVGASAKLPLKTNRAIRMEMVFIQKGSRKVWKNDLEGTQVFSLKLNYIQVPVVTVWNINERLAVDAGLSFGVFLSEKLRDENGYTNANPNPNDFKPFEFAGLIGLDYDLGRKWHLNFRYSNSILHVRDHRFGQKDRWNRGQYNSILEFTLRYIFGKKDNG